MRWICLPMRGVEFLDVLQNGRVKLGVKLRICKKIGLISNQIVLVRFVVKPIKHIIVGTTRIRGYPLARKKHQVPNFFLLIKGENSKIGATIGIEAIIITVGISQLPVGIPIGTIIMRKSTIRSTFVK